MNSDVSRLTDSLLFRTFPDRMENLIYWVVAVRDQQRGDLKSAKSMARYMSQQRAAEEQASTGEKDDVVGPVDVVPAFIEVFSPVQYVGKWSPFPVAYEIIGDATFVDIVEDPLPSVVAFWNGVQAFRRPLDSEDTRAVRVYDLLRIGHQRCASVAIVALRGYDFADRFLSEVAQTAMRRFGFEVWTRSPG